MTLATDSPSTNSSAPILVVEDDADARAALIDILDISGYSAVPAANGREALSYLQAGGATSLIILDLYMPEMDGWEFRREQKQDPRFASLPVVVVTAISGARIDASHILIKPLDVDQLLKIVGRYVAPERKT